MGNKITDERKNYNSFIWLGNIIIRLNQCACRVFNEALHPTCVWCLEHLQNEPYRLICNQECVCTIRTDSKTEYCISATKYNNKNIE